MDQLQSLVDGFIDFEGQKLAETLTTILLTLAGAVAWIVGFVLQDLRYTAYVGLGGTAVAFLIIVPPWPFYNKHAPSWLPAGATGAEDKKLQ